MSPKLRNITAPFKKAVRRIQRPILSVIIPVYNGESTIEAAVRSALNQRIDRMEVLVVDDESTDTTPKIVERLASRDRRVRLLNSGHTGGPGRARNLGVAAARGRYLTFIDADDRALPGAYARMLTTIMNSHSQFISGGYRRVDSAGSHRPEISRRVHAKTVLGVKLEQFPAILEEPLIWNKIYLSKFWKNFVGPIPEDRNYEDQEPATRAALRASSFDIVDYDVYAWSLPEGRRTRSQSKRTEGDLDSRRKVVGALLELAEEMPANAKDLMRATILGRDLIMYLKEVPYTSDRYWEILHSLLGKVWRESSPNVIRSIPFVDRLLSFVGASGTREEVEDLISGLDQYGRSVRWTKQNTEWRAELPWWDPVALGANRARNLSEAHISDLGPNDWRVVSRVWSMRWEASGELYVSGYGYVPGVDPCEYTSRTLELVDSSGNTLASSPILPKFSDWIDVEAGDAWTSYNQTGFETRVSVPAVPFTDLHFEIRITIDGADVHAPLLYPTSAPKPLVSHQGTHDLVARSNAQGLLVATKTEISDETSPNQTVAALTPVLREVAVHGNSVTLSGSFPPELGGTNGPLTFALMNSTQTIVLPTQLGQNRWTATLDLADPTVPSVGLFLRWRQKTATDSNTSWHSVRPGSDLISIPATRIIGDARSIMITKLFGSQVGITLGPPLSNEDRSRYGRQRLAAIPPDSLHNAVVFDSFTGKSAGDNPLAVFQQLTDGTLDPAIQEYLPSGCESWPRYWSINDGTQTIPDNTKPLIVGSAKWFRIVRSARLLVTNNNLPATFTKTAGQFWLQTWHGTPLKRLLFDAPRTSTSSLYRRLMTAQSRDWDLLLAQDEQAAMDLRSSARYAGNVLVVEQPRNARLKLPQLREDTRRRLGIAPDAKVILYAPTWRKSDVDSQDPGDYMLDPKALAEQTGATVLVRTHHMSPKMFQDSPHVIDVSNEPRVEDLMVASDELISDYSSIFFDYTLLNQPMFTYVPDLDEYQNDERGFYRDWPEGVQRLQPPRM